MVHRPQRVKAPRRQGKAEAAKSLRAFVNAVAYVDDDVIQSWDGIYHVAAASGQDRSGEPAGGKEKGGAFGAPPSLGGKRHTARSKSSLTLSIGYRRGLSLFKALGIGAAQRGSRHPPQVAAASIDSPTI